MLILNGSISKLKNSKFYNEDCWDYPYEEEKMLWEDETYSEVIYVKAEDGRIYETTCTSKEINELIELLEDNRQFKHKDFYCAFINDDSSICELSEEKRKDNKQLNVYISYGEEIIKVNTLYLEKSSGIEETKNFIDEVMCQEIGKILEDGTIEKEYFGQGYIYKNFENFYRREGVCYVPEYDGNKIGEAGISYEGIREEVIEYIKMCGVDIDKVPERTIDGMVEDIFENLDWQHCCSLIHDQYLEGYIEEFPDDYFINKEDRENNEEEQEEGL